MKTKLHFGILIVLLAFFGRYLEQSTTPNQQIVIQFSDENISDEDAVATLATIQKRLEIAGAVQIKIGQTENGNLIITYHSDAEVYHIQSILLDDKGLELSYQSNSTNSQDIPNQEQSKDYELNISEIQNVSHVNWDFQVVECIELNQKTDWPNKVKVNATGDTVNSDYSNTNFRVVFKINNSVALAIDNGSCIIPEVRAGPTS